MSSALRCRSSTHLRSRTAPLAVVAPVLDDNRLRACPARLRTLSHFFRRYDFRGSTWLPSIYDSGFASNTLRLTLPLTKLNPLCRAASYKRIDAAVDTLRDSTAGAIGI